MSANADFQAATTSSSTSTRTTFNARATPTISPSSYTFSNVLEAIARH
ncbi:hypothetical protein O1L60_33010 [Streptomyces diastatochromogenes]|nr:hypothetical protein [Streptomyces diastatochromogenes]